MNSINSKIGNTGFKSTSKKEIEIHLKDLQSFGKGITLIKNIINSNKDSIPEVSIQDFYGKDMILTEDHTMMITPYQELPKEWDMKYSKTEGRWSKHLIEKAISFFDGESITIYIPNDSGPLVITNKDIMIWIASLGGVE